MFGMIFEDLFPGELISSVGFCERFTLQASAWGGWEAVTRLRGCENISTKGKYGYEERKKLSYKTFVRFSFKYFNFQKFSTRKI